MVSPNLPALDPAAKRGGCGLGAKSKEIFFAAIARYAKCRRGLFAVMNGGYPGFPIKGNAWRVFFAMWKEPLRTRGVEHSLPQKWQQPASTAWWAIPD